MKNKQKLKEVIWKANPSILELKFGCEIEGIKTEELDCTEINKAVILNLITEKTAEILVVNEIYDWKKIKNVPIRGFKILGRPIILEDILITAKDKVYKEQLSTDKITSLYYKIVMNWDWGKDLDNQDEIVIKELIKLLKKGVK